MGGLCRPVDGCGREVLVLSLCIYIYHIRVPR